MKTTSQAAVALMAITVGIASLQIVPLAAKLKGSYWASAQQVLLVAAIAWLILSSILLFWRQFRRP